MSRYMHLRGVLDLARSSLTYKPRLADAPAEDHVASLRASWARERPDVDTEGMAILGRARRITLLLRARIEAVFKKFGCDAGEFDVLASLRRAGTPYRLRPTELYQALMLSSGGMTDRLARLERAGLVARIQSEEDGRARLVELTRTGRALVDAAFAADMKLEKEILAHLRPAERRALARLLEKLAHLVEKRPQ
jgi:DNA-binding MarR family transcriptional regulator